MKTTIAMRTKGNQTSEQKQLNNFKLDFIGIGAEKAGTTWLANCLAEHPEICMAPGKELFFFNEYDPHFLATKNHRYNKWGFTWYKKQFKNCLPSQIKGEFTPTYLYCKLAAARIKKHFPDIKIIVALRDPTERAFSQFMHDKRIGLNKDLNLDQTLNKYNSYLEKGLYYKHLKSYFNLFPGKNIFILLFEDIKNNPKKTIKNIYQFLGVTNINFQPPSLNKKSNVAGKPRLRMLNNMMIRIEYWLMEKNFQTLHKFLEISGIRKFALWIRDINSAPISTNNKIFSTQTKKRLKALFNQDIKKLEKLIKRNLSSWKYG